MPLAPSPRSERRDANRLSGNGRALLGANALDAAGRGTFDFVTDIVAVTVLGASAAQMGLLNAASMAAFLLLSTTAGVLVDQLRPHRVVLASTVAKAVVAATVAVLLLIGGLTFWSLLACVVIFGVLTMATETGQTALVPRVAPQTQIPRLAARLQGWDSAMGIIVPGVAGIILGYLTGVPVLGVAAGLLLASALIMSRISTPAVPDSETEQATPAGRWRRHVNDLAAGVEPFRQNPSLRRLTASSAVLNAALAVISAVEMVFLIRVAGLSVATVGIAATIGAVGGLIGAALSERIVARLGLRRALIGSGILLVIAAAMLLLLLADLPGAALAALLWSQSFLWGLVQVAKNVATYAWYAEAIPAEVLGRATGLRRTVTMGVVPIASLIGGAIGLWSIPATLVVGVLLTALSAALMGGIFDRGQQN